MCCNEHPRLPPGAAAPACFDCHHPKLITPVHYTDELDWPQSIALMKCHLFKPQPSREARWGCWGRVGAHQGSQCSVWVMLELWLGWWGRGSIPGKTKHSWVDRAPLGRPRAPGWTENHRVDRASLQDAAAKEETLAVLPLFKMQLCKGHRGGDETRSCNKEGEIKNNDRNKLS